MTKSEQGSVDSKTCPTYGGTWPSDRRNCLACGANLESVPAWSASERQGHEPVLAENCHPLRSLLVKPDNPKVSSTLCNPISNGFGGLTRIGIGSGATLEILVTCGRLGLRGFQPSKGGDMACIRGP
jgi:hypothetical protein